MSHGPRFLCVQLAQRVGLALRLTMFNDPS